MDEGFERRVKRRIFGELRQNAIIEIGNDSSISVDLMASCDVDELAAELKISIDEAECLKLADPDWEKSLHSVFYQIHSQFGARPVVLRAISAIKELRVSDREELLSISHSKQCTIPLAVRAWLEGEGVLKNHAKQQSVYSADVRPPVTETHSEKESMSASPGISISSLAQINREPARAAIPQNKDLGSVAASALIAGSEDGSPSSNVSMNSERASALLEEAHRALAPSGNLNSSSDALCHEEPDSASGHVIGQSEGSLDSLEWEIGRRIEYSSSSGERQVGTVEYLSKEGDSYHSIAVMDDGSIMKFSTESNDTVRCIQGRESEETAHSLIAVILKAANGGKRIAKLVGKYLHGQGQARQGCSQLEAVALSSKALKETYPGLKFLRVIGEGGFGTVLSVDGPTGPAAVKMELRRGHPNHTDLSLWREFNLLQAPPKELTGNVPKLVKSFGPHSFTRICSSNTTVSFLSMECLIQHASGILRHQSLIEGSIPDSYRQLAQYQCLILEKVREAGISHGDIKNHHFMQRPHDDSVVLVDWGLSERREFEYRTERELCGSKPAVGKLLYSSVAFPARQGASAVAPSLLRLGLARPGTPGNRPQNAVQTFAERHQADVWALAVGWLEGVGLVPHLTGCADQFEQDLYVAARSCFDDFSQFVARNTVTGFNSSVITWLKLIYSVLHGGESVLHLLKEDPALTQPFYAPTTLEKLRTTGIIVPGVKAQGPNAKEVKPILIMHLDGVGLILLCLLFSIPGEIVLFYGGQIVDKASDEMVLYPSHNLPLGVGDELLGAVSRFFTIEDFIQETAVGSFAKSSNVSPKVSEHGTLKRPLRLSAAIARKAGRMAKVPMVARVAHGPGMQPTWPYDWNASTGDAIFDEQKINKLQALANQPVPSHVWTAVANARAEVLRLGEFKDAEMSLPDKRSLLIEGMPEEIYSGTSERDPDSTTLHSQATVQPLSPELVDVIERAVESSGGGTPELDAWDLPGLRSSAAILEPKDLSQHGFCVLDKIPSRRTEQINKALCAQGDGGQGILFMDGSGLALQSAKLLKEVEGIGDALHARVFNRQNADEPVAQQGCQTGVTSAKNASDKLGAGDASTSSGEGACDKSCKPEVGSSEGGGGADQSNEEESEPDSDESSSGTEGHSRGAGKSSGNRGPIVAWLLVVATFMSSLPDKNWAVIFQKLKGTKDQRSGDGRRAESKGNRWNRPERKDDECQEQFFDRLAGYYALRFFYDALFEAVTKILPYGSNISSQLFKNMFSLLASDGTEGGVEAQDPHTDIRPARGMRRFSALFNLSNVFSYLGILVNSCPNIKAMFAHEEAEFVQFQQQFKVTKSKSDPAKLLSDVMGKGTMNSKVRFAWRHHFAMNRPGQFRDMYPVYAKMPPIMVALFDTDTVHWGPPFPMPGIEYPIPGLRIVHYR